MEEQQNYIYKLPDDILKNIYQIVNDPIKTSLISKKSHEIIKKIFSNFLDECEKFSILKNYKDILGHIKTHHEEHKILNKFKLHYEIFAIVIGQACNYNKQKQFKEFLSFNLTNLNANRLLEISRSFLKESTENLTILLTALKQQIPEWQELLLPNDSDPERLLEKQKEFLNKHKNTLNTLQKLDLTDKPIFDISLIIPYLHHLEVLNIVETKIKLLNGFELLDQLKELNLSCSAVRFLDGIENLKTLVTLNIKYLNLQKDEEEDYFFDVLSQLTNLRTLVLDEEIAHDFEKQVNRLKNINPYLTIRGA